MLYILIWESEVKVSFYSLSLHTPDLSLNFGKEASISTFI